ncbi:MAG: sugar phosphate nucleotidyltransferase [Christensenellales bacterium]
MKAIVMAGGGGKRLRPLTCTVPKPMVKILDRPMLEYTLEHLFAHGINYAAMTLGFLPSVITDYFERHKINGMHISYYIEDSPLGTAGGVKNAASFIDGTFLVISGDALTDIDLTKMKNEHKQSGAKATIALKRMGNPRGYGVVITGGDGNVERFVEKPGWEDVFSDKINTGIYMLEPEVLDLIPDKRSFDFAKDLFPLMLGEGMAIYGHVTDGYWCDVGSVESYIRVHEDMLRGMVNANISGRNISGIWVGDNVRLSDTAFIQPPGFIGAGASIGDGARIGRYSCIGANAHVGAYSSLSHCVLHEGARVGRHARLSGCVVAVGGAVGERCSVREEAVVGERCRLGQGSRVSPRVRIWPDKSIGFGARANENIMYGYGERSGFFGSDGFAGDLGVDLTPLRLSRLFGAVAEYMSGKTAAVSAEASAVCEAAGKLAAGMLTLSGADVFTFRGAQRPVLALCAHSLGAGLCVTLRTHRNRLYADVFEPDIFMLSKAARGKIEEKYFNLGETLANRDCGAETSAGAAENFYINAVAEKIDWSAAKRAGTRVAVYGRRGADDLLARTLLSCGIGAARLSGGKYEPEADFGVRLNRNGTVNSLFTPKGRVLSADECRIVWYYLIFSGYNKNSIKLQSGVLRGITAMADIFGISYGFASAEESLKELSLDQRRLLFDGIFAVCRLAEHIARTGASLDEIADMISPPHVRVKAVRCGFENIGRVISEMYAKGGAHASEGLRINLDKGSGYICPHSTRPSILIRTEADTEEFAEELCAEYTDMVKKIIEK